MDYKFSWKTFFFGEKKEDWQKAASRAFKIAAATVIFICLVSGAFSLWRVFFPKPSSNIYKPFVIALPGSRIDKLEQKSEQKIINQTRRLHVSVGAALYGGKEEAGTAVGVWVTYDLF